MKTIYTFREVTDANELEEWLRLRYEIYANSPNKVFLHENAHRIDMDCFDVHSRHFALMQAEKKVGYVRVVYPKDVWRSQMIIDIDKKYSLLTTTPSSQPDVSAPLPFLTYQGIPTSYWDYYKNIKSRYENVYEASRLVIRPEYRGVHMSKLLLDCALAIYTVGHPPTDYITEYVVVNCYSQHRALYVRYGFEPIAGVEEYITKGHSKVSLVLPVRLASIPEDMHDNFRAMADEFSHTLKIERAL